MVFVFFYSITYLQIKKYRYELNRNKSEIYNLFFSEKTYIYFSLQSELECPPRIPLFICPRSFLVDKTTRSVNFLLILRNLDDESVVATTAGSSTTGAGVLTETVPRGRRDGLGQSSALLNETRSMYPLSLLSVPCNLR